MFAREAVADLKEQREQIEARGARVVLVHMSPPEDAEAQFRAAGLPGVLHVSDPDRRLYAAFELGQMTGGQMLNGRLWWRGLEALRRGHRQGRMVGDGFQLGGAFLVHRGAILAAAPAQLASDRPDYAGLTAGLAASPAPATASPPSGASGP